LGKFGTAKIDSSNMRPFQSVNRATFIKRVKNVVTSKELSVNGEAM